MKKDNNYIKSHQTHNLYQTQHILCNHNRYQRCYKCYGFFNISSLYLTSRGYYCSFCIHSRD